MGLRVAGRHARPPALAPACLIRRAPRAALGARGARAGVSPESSRFRALCFFLRSISGLRGSVESRCFHPWRRMQPSESAPQDLPMARSGPGPMPPSGTNPIGAQGATKYWQSESQGDSTGNQSPKSESQSESNLPRPQPVPEFPSRASGESLALMVGAQGARME